MPEERCDGEEAVMVWMIGLMASAWAAPPAAVAEAVLSQEPGMLLSCAPMGTMVEGLLKIPMPPSMTEEEEYQRMQRLLDPETLEASGVDLSDSVSFWASSDGTHILLPVRGDVAQQQALLELLFAEQELTGTGPWVATSDEGEVTRIESGDLVGLGEQGLMVSGPLDSERLGGAPAVPSLIQGMPAGHPGCLIYVPRFPDRGAGASAGPVPMPAGVSAWFPFEDGPMILRVKTKKPLQVDLSGEVAPPMTATSTRPPVAWLSVGVELLPIIFAPDAPWADKMPPDVTLADVERRMWLPGGITMALFNLNKDAPDLAVLVPVQNRRRKPARPGQLRRMLKKVSDEDLIWTSRTTFTIQQDDDLTLHGSLEKGRVVLASEEETMADVLSGAGQPWVTAEGAARASRWPIYVEGSNPMMQGVVVSLGVSVDPETDTVVVGLETPGRPLREIFQQAMAAVGPMMQANLEELQARINQPSDEPAEMLAEMCSDQLAYRAMKDRFTALPPEPRPLAELDERALIWVTPPSWADVMSVGGEPYEAPRAGELLHGVYWAEVSADGQRVIVRGAIHSSGGEDGATTRYRMACGEDAAPEVVE